ncbi:MAG: diaminopimelate decarboxylase [Granulosicoccus sp.]
MKTIEWRDNVLTVEGVSCVTLAEDYGTPLFVYSRRAIETAWREFDTALTGHDHLVCYSVKANSNLAVLQTLVKLGSGFDIVSGGEFKRVLAAGGSPDRIVFSGVGKTAQEITTCLKAGIRCFNVESISELERLAILAEELGVVAPVSLRINPDVDAQTHPYISTGLKENKFGIGMQDAMATYRRAADLSSIDVQGIDCHIGSQLTRIEPYADALTHLLTLVDKLRDEGIVISHIDVGGGQGIQYDQETPLDIAAWASCVRDAVGARKMEIIAEPGRYIAGPAGVLLTRVEYLKSNDSRHFAVVDAAMNDVIRPALYGAWQAIEPVIKNPQRAVRVYDVVGPICESADFLGKQRSLGIAENDLLAVMSTGAYCAVMSSNYNTRPRSAEVMVDGETSQLVRAREQVDALFADEYLLP